MKRYPQEINNFIAENVKGTTTKELAILVNARFRTDFTESKMKSYKANYKLKSGTPCGLPAGRSTELYFAEIREFIKENYAGNGPKNMTELLNKTFGTNYTYAQIDGYYNNHNIDSGLDGKFQKGHIPPNKGKKGTGGWEPTQFKKGCRPVNFKPIGSERVNIDGYTEIKIADPNKWRLKHQVIWEAANGPMPKGHGVIFGDGKRSNCDINNLILVSQRQLLTLNRNKLIQKDADLTRSAIIIVDVLHKMGDRTKIKRGANL
jgi:hypothetical protein